jgi:hypothetical protein
MLPHTKYLERSEEREVLDLARVAEFSWSGKERAQRY